MSQLLQALVGGGLIGLAASAMLLWNGRVAGISGISKGLLSFRKNDWAWRFAFVAGLALGGAIWLKLSPASFAIEIDRPIWLIAVAGVLVGFGTVMGNGCTSGHGVCGVARLSRRSLVATLTFMATGFLTVFLYSAFNG